MNTVSDENKILAKKIISILGGAPTIRKYWDDKHLNNIDILKCSSAPFPGLNSYSTLGVSDHPIMKGDVEYQARTEILGVCGSDVESFQNVMATCGFCIITSKWFVAPSVVFPDILRMYNSSNTMQHVAFIEPFLWSDRLEEIKLATKTVNWLLAVPISDKEYQFAKSESFDALEDLFERKQIDIFDINRSSVI